MKHGALALAALLVIGAAVSFAQTITAPTAPAATYTDDQARAAVTPLIPTASNVAPQAEAIGGALGADTTVFMRADAKVPRMSRSTTVTTTTGGVFSGTWSSAFSATPNIVMTPIFSGSGSVNCFLTAAPTTTTFAGKCTTDQSAVLGLSIVTAGLTVGPIASASGMSVQVFGIPASQ